MEKTDEKIDEVEGATEVDYDKLDYDKIDYSKLNPDRIPTDVVQHTSHFRGLVSEKQELKSQAQQLATQNENLMSELSRTDEDEDLDEPMTKGDFKKALKSFEEKRKAEQEEFASQQEKTRAAEISNRSLTNLAKRTKDAPPGLELNVVLRKACDWLAKNDPNLLDILKGSSDPAGRLYNIGITEVPELKKIAETAKNAQLIESLKKNQPRIPTGSTFSDADNDALQDLLGMPEEKILQMIQQEEQ